MTKKLVWTGFFLGSSIGSVLPVLWGGDMLSASSFLLSIAGGIVGIWLGYRAGRSL